MFQSALIRSRFGGYYGYSSLLLLCYISTRAMHGFDSSLLVAGCGVVVVLCFTIYGLYARGRGARAQRSERERQRKEYWGYE